MSEIIIPNHLGFILDGNRRWAKQQGLSTIEGHQKGAEVFRELALHAFRKGVNYVSGYVFSAENWQRTEEEVGYLMGMVAKAVENYLESFQKEGIKIVILGRRDGLRSKVLNAVTKAEEDTKNNTKGTLALCFNYGGQEEIVDAVKSIVADGMAKEDVTKDLLYQRLYHPEIPPLDMIVRTSGEYRLSGFMLWRSDYAELSFVDKYLPDFTNNDVDACLDDYAKRSRRFGN